MKKRLLALLCCILLLGLPACSSQSTAEGTPPEGTVQVYYAVIDEERGSAAVDYEYRTPPEHVQPVPALMNLLLAGPQDPGLVSPFPAGVRLLSWRLDDGLLHLNLSGQYNSLSGVDLTVADYCIVLTMSQLDGVVSVYITADGEELPFRHTQHLQADDVILSGAEEEIVHVGVNLWFPRAGGSGLGVEFRQVTKTEENTLRDAVLAAWLDGPEYGSLTTWIPEGTEILSVSLDEGICYVDLSSSFRDDAPTDPQQAFLLLYALVNTMGGLDSVDGVQLLIEGERIPLYGGVDTSQPLTPDLSLEKN